jgi:hypothetical protein
LRITQKYPDEVACEALYKIWSPYVYSYVPTVPTVVKKPKIRPTLSYSVIKVI